MKFFLLLLSGIYAFSLASCAQQDSAKDKSNPVNHLSAPEFNQMMEKTSDKQIIDVRTSEEFGSGYIEDAQNIDIYLSDFQAQINQLDKNKPVFVYCKGGGRSDDAADLMKKAGFQTIYALDGGIMAWANKNYPVVDTELTTADTFTRFDYDKLLSENSLLLIDYYAPWCSPCKKMEPALAKLAIEFQGRVNIVRIDVDEAKALSKELNIENIPVITTIKNGKEVMRVNGLQTEEQLRAMINSLLD